jgi:hypothetical protein
MGSRLQLTYQGVVELHRRQTRDILDDDVHTGNIVSGPKNPSQRVGTHQDTVQYMAL